MKISKNTLKILSFIIILVFVVISYRTFVDNRYLFRSEEITLLNEDWTYQDEKIDISKRVTLKTKNAFTIEKTLPDDFKHTQHILLRTSLANVTVHLDDQLLYEDYLDEGIFKVPAASLWHVVKIPGSSHGKTLKLTYSSPFKKLNGVVNPVRYSTRGNLMLFIIECFGQPFIIDIMILFFGLLLLLLALIIPKGMKNDVWHIGLFSIFVAAWLISESRMLQFFSGNPWLIGSLAFISLPLIPIPFLYYIKSNISKQNERPINFLIGTGCLLFGSVIVLELFNIASFYTTVKFSHFYLLMCIIIVLKQIFIEIRVNKNKIAKHILTAMMILFAFTALEMFRYHLFLSSDVTVFVRIGLLIFIIMLSRESGVQILNILKKSFQAEFYEKMAYKDQLTQGPNRMAFDRDLELIYNTPLMLAKLRLVILDVNQLKTINDNYGHVTGDEAIKTSYELIDRHFDKIGKAYRIGGDEFACLITKGSEIEFKQCCHTFDKNIKAFDKTVSYPFGIALGSALYDNKVDTSLNRMMHRADSNMYEAKNNTISLF